MKSLYKTMDKNTSPTIRKILEKIMNPIDGINSNMPLFFSTKRCVLKFDPPDFRGFIEIDFLMFNMFLSSSKTIL